MIGEKYEFAKVKSWSFRQAMSKVSGERAPEGLHHSKLIQEALKHL